MTATTQSETELIDPLTLVTPRRKITGISAILLPYTDQQQVDWQAFDAHVERTFDAGLTPAVNMDTGYANLIDEQIRQQVLQRTQRIGQDRMYVAGVFVGDQPGEPFNAEGYRRGIEAIQSHGGTPIFFQSYGLVELPEAELVEAYRTLASECEAFLFFELGEVFAPFGRIYSLDVYQQLMQIPAAIGAKHSSLRREPEWRRLALRNRIRPEFKVFTGNDLAIDMVMYGSDYLLGLSTFAPEAFARRDAYWESGSPRFYELNDLLQYLGAFAFRSPAPAYKHSAAMFLKLRDKIPYDQPHPEAPRRPESDRAVLEPIADSLDSLLSEAN